MFNTSDKCEIHGIVRKNSRGLKVLEQFEKVCNQINLECSINLHYGDVSDSIFMINLIKTNNFDFIYNFAA